MWNHTLQKHNGVINNIIGDYKIKLLKSFEKPLSRVLEEAVQIQNISSDPRIEMLNTKIEYYTPQYVRPIFVKGPAEH